ncbi:K+ channel tetramerization domain containing protein [Gigaspora margarita]|uniref:K+ channel tetramerization domain containing protein n=1 Tax=Gigaspora margarita TaxID=4874 RepID=A0A8H4ADC6_GIGMA|nr:K+ channel tetramerization domain containing protein [Gigaspora margarita]
MSDASLSSGYYSIIVGGKTFKLSTTSLYSDSPNYFTEIFSSPSDESRTKTMIVDRDPRIFEDIVSGFSHGWEPPTDIPPAIPLTITPPKLDRDPELFADILRYLQGYEIGIKDEVHRQNLLKDARFYHLKGLAEKLLASTVTLNGFAKHDCAKNEILFRLKDIRTSGVIVPEFSNNGDALSDEDTVISTGDTSHIMYKNKEGTVYILLVEVHNAHLICRYDDSMSWETPTILELVLSDKEIKKLKDIAKAIKALGEIEPVIRSPEICAFEVDEIKCTSKTLVNVSESPHLIKDDDQGSYVDLFVTKGILKLFVNNERKIEMELLKCEAFSSEKGFNRKREFLPADKRIAL